MKKQILTLLTILLFIPMTYSIAVAYTLPSCQDAKEGQACLNKAVSKNSEAQKSTEDESQAKEDSGQESSEEASLSNGSGNTVILIIGKKSSSGSALSTLEVATKTKGENNQGITTQRFRSPLSNVGI